MLGREATITYDQHRQPRHVYIEPHFQAEFQEAMREVGILVELVEQADHRQSFRLVDSSRADFIEAAVSNWKERGHWRHRPR